MINKMNPMDEIVQLYKNSDQRDLSKADQEKARNLLKHYVDHNRDNDFKAIVHVVNYLEQIRGEREY